MKYTYDLLKEPWIPAVDQKGEIQELGILDTLACAHELRAITDGSPLVEYALHRFLCVFLMDALRPEEEFDIEDLLDAGKFDMEKILSYVQMCREEGDSFDLFHEERPFLQSPYRKEWDKEKKSAAYLDCRIPTGNNHIHFNHLDGEVCLSYGEAARFLPAIPLFITAGAQDYPSSVNAAPPFFSLIKGKNLFETLVNTLVPISEIQDFDSTPAFWRSSKTVVPKQKEVNVSWLYGMLYPARRVLLIPEEDGVREIYFSQGMNFCEPANWTDPHVTYRFGKDGRFPWRPSGKKAVWRNLHDLVNVSQMHAPKILELYSRRADLGKAHICLYGVETNQASFVDLFYHDLEIPMGLTRQGRAALVENCIGLCEGVARDLHNAMRCHGITENMASEAVRMFYAGCETALWQDCGNMLSAPQVDGESAIRHWKLKLYEIGKNTLISITERLNLTGREWLEFYSRQERLNHVLLKLRKEGKMTDE